MPSTGLTLKALVQDLRCEANSGPDALLTLLSSYQQLKAREAEAAFNAALAKLQPKLPVIDENGAILGPDGEPVATYATWEDTVDAIRPILARFGFSLSFRPGQSARGNPTVTGVLRHRGGHKEEGELELPPDLTGGKNAVQAVGSALSYGQRYVARMLLSLTSRGGDDDAGSSNRSHEAEDAIAEIDSAPDVTALSAWKRRSRPGLATLSAPEMQSVVAHYLGRRRALAAEIQEAQVQGAQVREARG
jgi:hypothetical protein